MAEALAHNHMMSRKSTEITKSTQPIFSLLSLSNMKNWIQCIMISKYVVGSILSLYQM